jgi:hypothetical protein
MCQGRHQLFNTTEIWSVMHRVQVERRGEASLRFQRVKERPASETPFDRTQERRPSDLRQEVTEDYHVVGDNRDEDCRRTGLQVISDTPDEQMARVRESQGLASGIPPASQ